PDGDVTRGTLACMPTWRARRADDVAPIVEWASTREPDSCIVLDRLLAHGLGRRTRVWVAEDEDRAIVGMMLLDRICFDRWIAHPLLEDVAAAEVLAPCIDSSPAWAAEGVSPHVLPFVGRLARGRQPIVQKYAEFAGPMGPPDSLFG